MHQPRAQLAKLRPHWDDDLVDKLNYFWTACILLLCTLTVGMKQYVGSPLQCWLPFEFKKFWEDYAEHYCFVENTYYVPMNESVPVSKEERKDRELHYYQWVPMVLTLQAFLFMLPRFIWQALNTRGLSVPALIDSTRLVKKGADKTQRIKTPQQAREDNKAAAHYWMDQVNFRRGLRNKPAFGSDHSPVGPLPARSVGGILGALGLPFGYYTTTVYLCVKMLYIVNVIGQFFIMNEYLAPQYSWWGFGILNDLLNGRAWRESSHFPRVTMCDFEVRKLGQLHQYTVQCVLILNMLNEKIYIFIWWWFFFVASVTIVNTVYWLYASLYGPGRLAFVSTFVPRSYSDRQLSEFVYSYLKPDGVLVLRMISTNSGEIACQMLVQKLLAELYPVNNRGMRSIHENASNDAVNLATIGVLESLDSSMS